MADISKITLNGTDYNVKDANLSAYTPTSGFSTINGSAITSGGNITISGGSGGSEEAELVAAAGIGDTRMKLAAEIRNNHFTKEDINKILQSYATKTDLGSYVQTSVLADLFTAVYNLIEQDELVTAAALNDLKIMIQ